MESGFPPISSGHDDVEAGLSGISDSSRDFFGNEISPAVATYKLDATGLLYEEHSPQTEIPRLAEPTS